MSARRRYASAAALLLAGLVAGLLTAPRRLADASTYLMMTDSLWADGDLACAAGDVGRADALALPSHPRGVFLIRHAAGHTYGKPLLYPAVAVPFYGIFGVRGFFVLNGMLLATLALLGADILAHRLPWPTALGLSAVVFGASVTPVYLLWIDPFLLCSVLIAGTVAAFQRGAVGLSAVLLTAAASCRPPYLALALAPIALCVLGRRWHALARFAIAGTATAVLLLGVNTVATRQWSPYAGERYYYPHLLPTQVGASPPAGRADIVPAGGRLPSPAALARTAMEFLVGRFAGALVYFPGLLICVVWSRRWDRRKLAWLLGLAASCLALMLAFPHNTMGGQHALGSRLFVMLPVALACVDFIAWSRWRILATAGLLLLALPILRRPVFLSENPGRQMAELPYRLLPVEWFQAARIRFPFRLDRDLYALNDAQFQWEGDFVWTRGGETAELAFVLYKDAPPRLRLRSSQPEVTVVDGGVPRTLDWPPGGEIELALEHPVARYHDESHLGLPVTVYTLQVGTPTGSHGYELGSPTDPRYLGVYVRPLPPPTPSSDSQGEHHG